MRRASVRAHVKHGVLIRQALPDSVADADAAVLQLDDTDSDAVHIQNEIGPPLMVPVKSDLLGAIAKSRFTGTPQRNRLWPALLLS